MPTRDRRKRDEGHEGRSRHSLQSITTDVSILLASIIAGAAIVAAIARCFGDGSGAEATLKAESLCQAAVVVVTTLRFFHGNAVWYSWDLTSTQARHDLTAKQEAIGRLLAYYVHTIQYLLFFAAGANVGNTHVFLWAMFLVSAVDVAWTLVNWLHESSDDLRKALSSWFFLNLSSAIILLVLILLSPEESTICWVVAGVYGVTGVLDYVLNPKLFFGVE